jgi:hypothetical protein
LYHGFELLSLLRSFKHTKNTVSILKDRRKIQHVHLSWNILKNDNWWASAPSLSQNTCCANIPRHSKIDTKTRCGVGAEILGLRLYKYLVSLLSFFPAYLTLSLKNKKKPKTHSSYGAVSSPSVY